MTAGLLGQLRQEVAAIEAAASHLVQALDRPTIALVNATTFLSDAEIASHLPALQFQVDRHYQPAWNRGAILKFVPRGTAPPASAWWLIYADDSDQAGAVGYHDETTAGLPQGKVFAGTDRKFGLITSVTASHELLEMIGDPRVKEIVGVYSSPTGMGRIYANEMCDPVEADVHGYDIGGIRVSDFILPAYFEPSSPGPWDYMRHLSGPLKLAPGGYQSVMDFSGGGGWQQLTEGLPELWDPTASHFRFADGMNPRTIAQPGSRRERRIRMAAANVRQRGGFTGFKRSTILPEDA